MNTKPEPEEFVFIRANSSKFVLKKYSENHTFYLKGTVLKIQDQPQLQPRYPQIIQHLPDFSFPNFFDRFYLDDNSNIHRDIRDALAHNGAFISDRKRALLLD